MQPKELDVVQLKDGRIGTILDLYDDGNVFYIEFADEFGQTIEMDFFHLEDIEKITYVA